MNDGMGLYLSRSHAPAWECIPAASRRHLPPKIPQVPESCRQRQRQRRPYAVIPAKAGIQNAGLNRRIYRFARSQYFGFPPTRE